MGTSQPAIARLESGRTRPITKTLRRYAEATGSSSMCAGLMRRLRAIGSSVVQNRKMARHSE